MAGEEEGRDGQQHGRPGDEHQDEGAAAERAGGEGAQGPRECHQRGDQV